MKKLPLMLFLSTLAIYCGSLQNMAASESSEEGRAMDNQKGTRELDMKDLFDKLDGLPWKKAFEDDCAGDWKRKWFLDGALANVKNTPEGMIFAAGPNMADDSKSMAVLWTNDSFKGDLKMRLEFTRLDDVYDLNTVNILYIQATGIGSPPYSEDISEWNALRQTPAMHMYFDYMRLLHISYAANEKYVRARLYPFDRLKGSFDKTTVIEPTYDDYGLFKKGITYVFTCVKTKDSLALKVAGDGKEKIFFWDVSKIVVPNHGRFGIRHMSTRVSRYKNVQIWEKP